MSFEATAAGNGSREASSECTLPEREIEHNLAALHQACGDTYKDLMGYACNLVGSNENAQDIVQQAFANTLVVVERGDKIQNMGGFLYRCVHNLCVNNARRKPIVSLSDEPYFEVANLTVELSETCPAVTAEIKERWREIEDIVDQLAPNQRNAFILAELKGYGYDEIAVSMDRSTNSVRQLISRARKKIRRIADVKSDWAGTPVPVLQAGLAFARERSLSGQKLFDRIQAKASKALAWLGKVFQGGVGAVLQYSASLIAGTVVLTLATVSPASPIEKSALDASPVAVITKEPGNVSTHTRGSTVRMRTDAHTRDNGAPADAGGESSVRHGQSKPGRGNDRRTPRAAGDRNEDSGGNQAEDPSLELKGQERRSDRRQERRSERRSDRRSERRSDRRRDRRRGRLRSSLLSTIKVRQPVQPAVLTGDDHRAGTSESLELEERLVGISDSDGWQQLPELENNEVTGAVSSGDDPASGKPASTHQVVENSE